MSSSKSTLLLEHHLKQLKLPTVLREYAALAAACTTDRSDCVPFSKAGAELLFEVVSRAYERQSLLVTTNLPFENWPEVCGSERLTGAMLDRLTHRVHILEANGESYRLKQSRRRLKRQAQADPVPPHKSSEADPKEALSSEASDG